MHKLYTLGKICLIVLLGIGVILIPTIVKTAPQGGQVESGTISIGSDTAKGIDTLITQQSQQGIINWQSFNIGATEHTHFAQPGASAVTLNRIAGVDPSSILGQLTATGKIFLVNPAGILFGPSARIDVAGLVATTANISSENFLAGKYYFVQGLENNAKIINQGYIKIADNGVAYLVAPGIENAGVIEARLGKVVLAASPANSAYTLDFYGDQLIQFALPQNMGSLIDDAITQKGRISAPGGRVLLTANSANSVVNNVINMSGVIEANTINKIGGEIILSGGEKGIVFVTGNIFARGNLLGELGGLIKIAGEKIGLFGTATIDVSGMSGGGRALIGADYLNNNIVSMARALYAGPDTSILANALNVGSGGEIRILSDESTRFYGTASAKGGPEGGAGGFVETSGNWLDVYGARIDVSAANGSVGTWLLDPFDVYIVSGIPPSPNGTWNIAGDPRIWSADANDSQLYVQDILNNLAFAGVTVNTGSGGAQAGDIYFNAALSYAGATARTLTLIAANNININAAITGANLDLVMQTLSSTGTISINNNGINIRNLTAQANGTTQINVNAVTTSAAQVYYNPVVLGANTTIINASSVNFANTIDSDSLLTPRRLDIDASGSVTLGGAIGSANPLSILNASFGGAPITISSGSVSTISTQNYNGPVTLGADTTFNSSSGTVIFDSTVDSDLVAPRFLTAQAVGVLFNDFVGSTNALSGLTVVTPPPVGSPYTIIIGRDIVTIGSQTYIGPVFLGSAPTLTTTGATGDIFFSDVLYTSPFQGFNINAGRNVTLAGGIGVYLDIDIFKLAFLNINAAGNINLGSQITTTGTQNYNSAVNLLSDTTLTGGAVNFASTINSAGTPRSLTINIPGDIAFGGAIGAVNPLQSLIINNTGTISFTGGVSTVGSQTYNQPIILLQNSSFTTSNNLIFNSITGPSYTLTLNAYNAVGSIDVYTLILNTTFANLTGLVRGDPSRTYINIPNPIASPGTNFFNGIDLYTPPNEIIVGPSPTQINTTLSTIQQNFVIDFSYQAPDTGPSSDTDYVLLTEPTQCIAES